MKKTLATTFLTLALCSLMGAQNYNVREEIAANPELTAAYNYVQYFGHGRLTKSPKGYKPFYISHYARHGARYAWEDVYLRVDTLLHNAERAGVLTDYGKTLLDRVDALIPATRGRIGELTPKGWKQHIAVADNMMRDFPEVFKAGPYVRATSSPVLRCVMSMASTCMEIARKYPGLDIYEDMSTTLLNDVLPTERSNPFPRNYGPVPAPFPEGHSFLDKGALASKVVSDPEWLEGNYPAEVLCWDIYTMGVGMYSLDTDISFDDFFTPEEKELFWMGDNLDSFNDGFTQQYRYYPVARSFVDRANECIAGGGAGIDLRFGHDSVVQPLVVLLNINGHGHVARTPEEQMYWFQNYNICMATNLVFVLYKDRKGSDILFKLLWNGEEAALTDLTPVDGPYYRWDDFVQYVDAIGVKADGTRRKRN